MAFTNALLVIETLYRPLGLQKKRRLLLAQAYGDVLEIGSGRGVSLPHLLHARSITLLEPDEASVEVMRKKIMELGVKNKAKVVGATLNDAYQKGLVRTHSFDSVVFSFSLCSVGDPQTALQLTKSLLKEGGTVFFIEHTAARNRTVRSIHHAIGPYWTRATAGCRIEAEADKDLLEAGFSEVSAVQFRFPMGWPIFSRGVTGRAKLIPASKNTLPVG
jgi:ubiquinone/menaquinone biosynthesis C-methylase UbiE